MRVLIVAFYFPPAGGGGVQRVLKLCRDLADLEVEVDVLAPDDPRFSARDPELVSAIPAGTTVHRAPYRGSPGETPQARLSRTHGLAPRVALHARLAGRRLLLPDPEIAWLPDALRVGTRVIREREIDCILTTSPPSSAHVIGAALHRRTGVRFVADLRDSWLANPHRRYERRSVRAKRAVEERIARRVLGEADAITAVTPFIAREGATLARPGTPVHVIPNGCDFDDFAGLSYTRGERMVVVHAGSFFGQRSPRPFLEAVARLDDPRVIARFLGDLRPADRAWALDLGLGDRLEIDGFRPHRETLAAMKAADVLLLLVPRAGGRGLSVLSGKVYEYLASERPILALVPPEGAAAKLLDETGAAWIADPDDADAILAALRSARDAWAADSLGERTLDPEARIRLDRRTRAVEMADVLSGVHRPTTTEVPL
jgi:glycosyltransferase involved in cell wall biosynthesis